MESSEQPTTEVPKDAGADERSSYSEDGVDLTLIRWMLSLTIAERLEVLRQHNEAIVKLRDANPHL